MIGLYDIHCHLLPGVDDGSKDMEMTRKLLKMEYEQGVRTIYMTSHYRQGLFETSAEEVQRQFELTKKEAEKISPELEVRLGCEFHSCMDMTDILNKKLRPTMGDSRFVLIEFSDKHDFLMIKERCFALISTGCMPIIAHAERYPVLFRRFDYLETLIGMGVNIQMNANNILGVTGLEMKSFCRRVMEMNLLRFVGSDAHDLEERAPQIGKCADYIEEAMGTTYAKRIFVENPRNIM